MNSLIELIITVIVLAAVLIPVVTGIVQARSRAALILTVIASLLAPSAIICAVAVVIDREPAEAAVTSRPIEVEHSGYVTSQTCRSCHPNEHSSWHRSYHRTMTQRVSPQTVLGIFDGRPLQAFGETYRHIREGDDYFVEMKDPFSSKAGEAPVVRKRFVMSTGSHHMQVYWYESGDHRRIIQSPFAFLVDDQRWVPTQSTFLKEPLPYMNHIDGGWNQVCNMCHATGSRPGVQDPTAFDTQVAEFGISCEACHGPAEEHVRLNRSPARRYRQHLATTPDDSIINPAHEDPATSAQICGQCHGIWHPRKMEDFQEWQTTGFDYRPGMDLNERRFVFSGNANQDYQHAADLLNADTNFMADRFWEDGMVRVTGREYNGLTQSPCYTHGDQERGVMSCLSCHELHPADDDTRVLDDWADDQLAPQMRTNEACLQCHEDYRDRIVEHTHHPVNSSGSECMNCHMSYTTYGLYKAIRSHQVDSPSVQTTIDTGRPNACNQCHLDQSLEWSARHLNNWFEIEMPDLEERDSKYAAGVVWALAGDAGQRALTAWSMGWPAATETSGSEWMVPYLAQLLMDPYDAVRYIAHRSLQRIPGYENVSFDFVGPKQQRDNVAKRLLAEWNQHKRQRQRTGAELLIGPAGGLQIEPWTKLYQKRNNRRINLEE